MDSECRRMMGLGVFSEINLNYPVYSILKNSLESNLDSKKDRIYISYVKGLFEYVYHSTIERNCTEVTKGLLLEVSVYEDGHILITSWLSCQRFNKLSSC